jgi:hypothetical protein
MDYLLLQDKITDIFIIIFVPVKILSAILFVVTWQNLMSLIVNGYNRILKIIIKFMNKLKRKYVVQIF